jgi:hypothetical protein
MSQHFQLDGTVWLFIYRESPLGTVANRATMAELGILLRLFFSHDIVIRLSKRSEVIDDLTADFIKSTLLWLRSHEADVTGKVSKYMTSF